MRSNRLRLIGAAAAVLGGMFWMVKAVAILVTGVQPPLLFEVAPVLFALGLIGLHARFRRGGGLSGMIGLVLACVSGSVAVLGVVTTSPSSGESFSAAILGSFLANLGALVFLGVAVRRERVLPGRWSFLPLTMGLATFPLVAVGGALESINERLLEVPLVLLALAWMGLGYLIWLPSFAKRDSGGARVPTA